MFVKFASLKEPEQFGYAYDSDTWDSHAPISHRFRQFATYGDVHTNGNVTQHSGAWSVQVEYLADFLASLATAMMDNTELIQRVSYDIERAPTDEAIAFAASVIFKAQSEGSYYEKKSRWFSIEERKITTTAEKRYDKRYQPVEQWCDGSVEAIYRMLIPEFARGMEYYCYANAIREWCLNGPKGENRPYFEGLPAQFLKWLNGDHHKALELRYAFNACKSLCDSYRQRRSAECDLSNLHWPPVKPAEAIIEEVANG